MGHTPPPPPLVPPKDFLFSIVSSTNVLKHLRSLKKNKAVGLDNLPASFLKDIAFVITKPLTHVINRSLIIGVVPIDFKSGKITPIYKSGPADDLNNYRPITVLSSVSKILEKCVHDQVMNHLESNNLLSVHQFGFRAKRSTELAATSFIDSIRLAMDNGEYTGAVYIDLSKAFDTISHASILNKLPNAGINGVAKEWFTNYLFGRSQQVCFNGAMSDPEPVYCGVPQGSILGPLLFLLHFNDSAKTLKHCKIVKYADDTVLFVSDKNIEIVESFLNTDVYSFFSWLKVNELIVNLKKGKTEFMVFATSQRLKKLPDPPISITFNNTSIAFTTSYKYLGLTLNNTLNMTLNFQKSMKKASSRINLLRRIRYSINATTASAIYRAMIIPTLTYCPLITSFISETSNKHLKRLEKRASDIISRVNPALPDVATIKRKRCCVYVHKCLKGDVCANFKGYFKPLLSNINTRNNGLLVRLPKMKLEVARRSFYFQGGKCYNELPLELRNTDNINSFKNLLNEFYN